MIMYQATFFSEGDSCQDICFNAYFTDRKKAVLWCHRKANEDLPDYIRLYPSLDYFVGIREWFEDEGLFRPIRNGSFGTMHFLTEYTHDKDGNIEPLNLKHLDKDYFRL